MKRFLTFFIASCLGTIVAVALLFGVIAVIAVASQSKPTIADGSILRLELDRQLPEKTDNVERNSYDFSTDVYVGLQDVVRVIRHAKENDDVSALLIRTQYPTIGKASATSIRSALEDFKESGKAVLAYGDFFSQTGYYLATVADSIYLNPNGSVELRGFAAVVPFYKKIMEKVGVKMNIYYAGKYKSATEPYRESKMSEESRFQTREFLNDLATDFMTTVSESRDIQWDDLQGIIDDFRSTNSASAIEFGLADKLVYWSEFENILKHKVGLDTEADLTYTDIDDYLQYLQKTVKQPSTKNKIAVVYAEGEIDYYSDKNGAIGQKRYQRILEKLRSKDHIKAVVLRVNSPGGSGFASDLIWQNIEELKRAGKTVVASFGDYATSGGYYISTGAHKIVAEPNTLTGSIGVYIQFPDVRDLMEEKIGIHFDTVKTHDHAITMSPFFNMRPDEDAVMKKVTDDLYAQFLDRVSQGRGMEVNAVDDIAQGRIWSGRRALEIGLVDRLGDLDSAIELAAHEADLESYKIVEYPKQEKNFYRDLLATFMDDSRAQALAIPESLKEYKSLIDYFNTLAKQEGPQARLPFFLDIH